VALSGSARMPNKAELRVVLCREGICSLLLAAVHRENDLYCFLPGALSGATLASSYHQTGKSHTKVLGAVRLLDEERLPLAAFRGRLRLWSGSWPADLLDWDYKLKPDSDLRRNLVLELDELPRAWFVDLWAIEVGRADLVRETLDEAEELAPRLAALQIAWTQPQLLAVARSIPR
jgi:hypothetical protein